MLFICILNLSKTWTYNHHTSEIANLSRATLPTVSPRCRRSRTCVFQWSLGLCDRATHAWKVQDEVQYRANCLPGLREPFKPDTVDPGLRYLVWMVPTCQHQGQLKERAGFLVGRSMTLSSLTFSTPWAGFVILNIYSLTQKKTEKAPWLPLAAFLHEKRYLSSSLYLKSSNQLI